MRKILILVIVLLLCFGCYTVITSGISLGNFKMVSIEDLEVKSSKLKLAKEALDAQNNNQYVAKKTALDTAVKNYKNKKTQYEELLPEMELAAQESSFSAVDLYDIDFLWTIIGNYATEESVTLKFDVTKNATVSKGTLGNSDEYIFCDLNFTVSGDYITITDFIYDLEDDDRLNFEISNFILQKGGSNLEATFVVKSVPINSKNLSALTTSSSDGTSTSTSTSTSGTTSNLLNSGNISTEILNNSTISTNVLNNSNISSDMLNNISPDMLNNLSPDMLNNMNISSDMLNSLSSDMLNGASSITN